MEGERRRKEMLAIASSLEGRYRTLLNPDKKPVEKKYGRPESSITSAAPEAVNGSISDEEPEEEAQEDEEEGEEEVAQGDEEGEEVDQLEESEIDVDTESPQRPSYHDESGESEVDFEERDRQRSKGLKLKIKFTPRTPSQLKGTLSKSTTKKRKQTTLSPFMTQKALAASRKADEQSPTRMLATTSILTTASTPSRARGPGGKFLPKGQELESASATKAHPRKRPRTDSLGSFTHPAKATTTHGESISSGAVRPMRLDSPGSRHYATYAGAAGKQEQTTCMLMVAALRNSAAPNARKTQRNVLAFGARVPQEIEVRDFEIPEWVLNQDAQDDPPAEEEPSDSEYTILPRSSNLKQESIASERTGLLSKENDEDVVQIAYLTSP
ncbi:uncharacterized protein B0H18DRAFT_457675 [Fomitopsis serialis]|uniref:uncharacterized protein n=1 Tax=Fomitopsis serialis TaxID=139415 RepID=UPI002007BD60|nr:uncharacterized protein B0H18DRAFT_457675 [Neoantrodia serialis]KAH9923637.1 hypothetical protein B0H18DRAFT_457675 [Neoantrodia serialis]